MRLGLCRGKTRLFGEERAPASGERKSVAGSFSVAHLEMANCHSHDGSEDANQTVGKYLKGAIIGEVRSDIGLSNQPSPFMHMHINTYNGIRRARG